MKMINRILVLPFVMVAALALLAAGPARAVVEIDINRANVEPLPIAITDFISNDAIGAQIAEVVAADLKRSGLFAPIGKAAFIEKITNPDAAPRFEDWRVINIIADAIYQRLTGERAILTAAWCLFLKAGPRPTARSSLPSWTRTAPTSGC